MRKRQFLFIVFFLGGVLGVFFIGKTVLAQGTAALSYASAEYPVLFFLYRIFSNKIISSFLAGLIFSSLIYISILVKSPRYMYTYLFKPSTQSFSAIAKRDANGTYLESFTRFQKQHKWTRGAFFTAALTLLIQILAFIILSLVILHAASQKDTLNAAQEKNQNSENIIMQPAQKLAGGMICRVGEHESQNCGNCGTRERVCLLTGTWGDFSACKGELTCVAGVEEEIACGINGKQKRICGNTCQWTSEPCVEETPLLEVPPATMSAGLSITRIVTEDTDIVVYDTDIPLLEREIVISLQKDKSLKIFGEGALSGATVIISASPSWLVQTTLADVEGGFIVEYPKTSFETGIYEFSGYFVKDGVPSLLLPLARLNIKIRISDAAIYVGPGPPKYVPPPQISPPPPPVQAESLWMQVKQFLALFLDNPILEKITAFVFIPLLFLLQLFLLWRRVFSRRLFVWWFFLLHKPALLFKQEKKPEAWGVVYDTLNKQPVPFAQIALYDFDKKRCIAVVLGDEAGRYLFSVSKGRYYLTVKKKGYTFPSEFTRDLQYDGVFSDLYHRQLIEILKHDDIITFDIPLDSAKKETSSFRVLWNARMDIYDRTCSLVFTSFSIIALWILPALWTIGNLILHIAGSSTILYYRAKSHALLSSFGTVAEHVTHVPLPFVIVRLFDLAHHRLIAETVTDMQGRYTFPVGPNDYMLLFQKSGYTPFRVEHLSVLEQDQMITQDVTLQKTPLSQKTSS